MAETVAYKVLTADEWAALQHDGWAGSELDRRDGFIHLSAAGQLTGTVERHFSGREGLIVAAIDLGRLGDAVRWERSRGGALFPHLYAALSGEEVIAHRPLAFGADGEVQRPA